MSPEHCRAARALLAWSQLELARRAKVGVSTIRDFEAGRRAPRQANIEAMRAALERAGVLLLNHGSPGAQLKGAGQGKRAK